jgi:hypothetical protein
LDIINKKEIVEMVLINLLNKYGNKVILFINNNPILAFVDEVKYKNNEITIFILIEYEIIDNNLKVVYKGELYNIKEYINYHHINNQYNHTELILYKKVELLTTKMNNLVIYKNNISIDDCKVDKESNILTITDNYNIISLKGNEIIGNDSIIDNQISHKIAINYIYNLNISNILRIKDDYFKIINIENLDNTNEFLILLCSKYTDNERI